MRLSVRERDGFRILMLGPEGWTPRAADMYGSEGCDGLAVEPDVPFDDLAFLLPLHPLRLVILGAARVRDLSALFEKEGVEELGIGLNVRDLRGIGRLINLTDLTAPFRKGFEEISGLSKLRSLSVEEWPKGVDLDILGKKPNLQHLWLAMKRTATISSEWFPSAPELREVNLYSGRLADTEGLGSLARLESLRFANTKVEDVDFAPSTSRLRSLELDSSGDVASLEPLRNHPRLAEIRLIGTTRIVDGDMTPLFDIPQRELLAVEHSHDNYTHSAADLRRRFPPR